MPTQKYRKKGILEEQKKAVAYYRTGLSYRQIGELMNKSHQWVKNAVDLLDRVPSK